MTPRRRLRPLSLAAALALATIPAGRAARGDPPVDGAAIERMKAEIVRQTRVNLAIQRGRRWVASLQKHDGAFELDGNPGQGPHPASRHRFGESALATLTLAVCGAGPDSPDVERALGYLRREWRDELKGEFWSQASTYSLSLLAMVLEALYYVPPAAAGGENAWYGNVPPAQDPCRYPRWAAEMLERIVEFLLEHQAPAGLFRYPGGLPGGPPAPLRPKGAGAPDGPMSPRSEAFYGPEDLSNTQYALLALRAGARCGVKVDAARIARVVDRLLKIQEENGPEVLRVGAPPQPAAGPDDGPDDSPDERYAPAPPARTKVRDHARGFGYTPGQPASGSMTAAGVSSLAVAKELLRASHALDPAREAAIDQGLWDAVAWLDANFSVAENPVYGSTWHYYYLYGLERAGILSGRRFVGLHDWYREGSDLLLREQQPDGRWEPPDPTAGFGGPRPAGMPVYRTVLQDTCFALLFLKRGTFPPDRPILEDPVVTPDDPAPAKNGLR